MQPGIGLVARDDQAREAMLAAERQHAMPEGGEQLVLRDPGPDRRLHVAQRGIGDGAGLPHQLDLVRQLDDARRGHRPVGIRELQSQGLQGRKAVVVERVDADARIGQPAFREHAMDLPRPGRRLPGRIGIGHARLPEHGRPHVRPEGALPEFRASVLEDDRVALGGNDDVMRDVDGRPQRHDRDTGAVADVDDVGEDECAEVVRGHGALHLRETVAPQASQIYHVFPFPRL